MTRCLTVIAAALVASIPLADIAEAHHERSRGDGVVRLRIGPIEFRTRPFARNNRRGVVVTRAFPFESFEAEDGELFPYIEGEDGLWRPRRVTRGNATATPELQDRGGAVAISMRPVPAPRRTAIIEEVAVLGPVSPPPVPVTDVGVATAEDVVTAGPEAFAILTAPGAMGLPELNDGRQYYVLNGRVVTLDDDAQKALTVAALEAALQ